MDEKKILERFSALFELVNNVHDRCKKERNVLTLVDLFAEHNCLAEAFRDDCMKYLDRNKVPSTQLLMTLNEIQATLHCSAIHIHETAQDLGTPIITTIVKQMVGLDRIPN